MQDNVLNNKILLLKEQRYFSKAKFYEREREGFGSPKSNVLTSGSPVANPKSGPVYPVFIAK
jgi:hypothetical protein